jgi:hypothetical protein
MKAENKLVSSTRLPVCAAIVGLDKVAIAVLGDKSNVNALIMI